MAVYNGWQGGSHIGEPVITMLNRVKQWLEEGKDVRIFTARVSGNNPEREDSINAIIKWSIKYIGRVIPITSEKDYGMIELWDDRCIQVIPNTGVRVDGN